MKFKTPQNISGISYPIREVTQNYQIQKWDFTLLGNASNGKVILYLPEDPEVGQAFQIKKIDSTSNSILIVGGSKTLDGQSFIELLYQYNAITVQFLTEWHIF